MAGLPLLSASQGAFLLGAGLLAGALNALAGGGSFISFPALISCGVAPISANATNALAIWPGLVSATWGYRARLGSYRRVLLILSAISIAGGAAGGLLVVVTPPSVFARIIPFLLLFSTVLLLINFRRRTTVRKHSPSFEALDHKVPNTAFDRRSLGQFAVGLYGGYFVGGAGLMQMALLSLFGIEDIQTINGLRNLFGVLMSGAALVTLIASGKIAWLPACALTIGSTMGGLAGGRLTQKINPRLLQLLIVLFGAAMTIYFFHKYY